jgi:predicted YcjX-like family ATPase
VIPIISDIIEQTRLAARALAEFGEGLVNPTVRLGVTGLSRAGKTVFITALVHGLVRGGRFPVFEPYASGRIAGARLAPQPDDAVPRFDYEHHVRALVQERRWPESTRHISELRVVIDYQSLNGAMHTLTLDIVDYPGEWLLDLPLLQISYEQWSRDTLARSRRERHRDHAARWHVHLATIDPLGRADESAAIEAARLFTDYLQTCRDDRDTMTLSPPGRFLMPGDLAGSPALTFAPLDLPGEASSPPSGSNWALMRRRYDAYRDIVVRPFFNEHFARLDRQIVLIDALSAFNAGAEAVRELQDAMATILDNFRIGRTGWLGALFQPHADRILFAATKADHLHHSEHDRLEAILRRMTDRAIERAGNGGADIDVVALAAVRATREGMVRSDGGELPAIIGLAASGEESSAGNGNAEIAVFPGDLPADPTSLFDAADAPRTTATSGLDYRFVQFRPPALEDMGDGMPALPHIRLDRAMQFLFGDRMR